MNCKGEDIDIGYVVDRSSIAYMLERSGFCEVEQIKESDYTRHLIGRDSQEVVGRDETVEVVGHISELDTVEIDKDDRDKFWSLDKEDRAEVMRVAESGATRRDAFYVYPPGVGFSSSEVAWSTTHKEGAIKCYRKEEDTMDAQEAVARYNAVSPKDAEGFNSPNAAAARVRGTLHKAGWKMHEIPSKQCIANYLDPLTFDDLFVEEVFVCKGSIEWRIKLDDQRHAKVLPSPNGKKVVDVDDIDMQTADPDMRVERLEES